jgi:hypothetical protein
LVNNPWSCTSASSTPLVIVSGVEGPRPENPPQSEPANDAEDPDPGDLEPAPTSKSGEFEALDDLPSRSPLRMDSVD